MLGCVKLAFCELSMLTATNHDGDTFLKNKYYLKYHGWQQNYQLKERLVSLGSSLQECANTVFSV